MLAIYFFYFLEILSFLQIEFEAERGDSFLGDIALDDILFKENTVPETKSIFKGKYKIFISKLESYRKPNIKCF